MASASASIVARWSSAARVARHDTPTTKYNPNNAMGSSQSGESERSQEERSVAQTRTTEQGVLQRARETDWGNVTKTVPRCPARRADSGVPYGSQIIVMRAFIVPPQARKSALLRGAKMLPDF